MALGEEMGGQVLNTGANLSAKAIEALLKILDRLFQLAKERSSAEYKNEKLKLEANKDKMKADKLLNKYSNMSGYVTHEKLKAAGVELTAANVHCTEEQFNHIAEMAKRQGILVSCLEDASNYLGGQKTYLLEFQKKDAARISDIVDCLKSAEKIDKIQKKMDELLEPVNGNVDLLPPDDRAFYDALLREQAVIRGEIAEHDNSTITNDAVESAFNQDIEKVEFETCMNRLTGKHIDKDTTFYVVDAINPDNYIKVHAEDDVYQGSHYIKSEYEVFNGNEKVFECNDGRFDGRPQNYWQSLVGQMKEKGNFSDEAVKFYSVEDMERYRAGFKREQENEIVPVQEAAAKGNYDEACKLLEAKINANGYEYDAERGVPVKEGVELQPKDCCGTYAPKNIQERVVRCEAYWSAIQLNRYRAIAELEAELSIAQAELMTIPAGTVEHAEMQTKVNTLSAKVADVHQSISACANNLKSINAMQVTDEVEQKMFISHFAHDFIDSGHSHEVSVDINPDITEGSGAVAKTMEQWKKEIHAVKVERGQIENNQNDKIGAIQYFDVNGKQTETIEFADAERMEKMLMFDSETNSNFKATLYTDSRGSALVGKDRADAISKAAKGNVEMKPKVPNINHNTPER